MRKLAPQPILLAVSVLLLAIVHLLTPAAAVAGTVDAYYQFRDYTDSPLNVRRVVITPIGPSAEYDGSFLSQKPINYSYATYPSLTNGYLLATNLITGYAYRVAFSDGFGEPTVTNYFGTNLSGTVGAVTNKTSYIQWVNGAAIQINGPYFGATITNSGSGGGDAILRASGSISIITNATGDHTPIVNTNALRAMTSTNLNLLNDYLVRSGGQIIADGDWLFGGALSGDAISSWSIAADGDAEFNDIAATNITATSLAGPVLNQMTNIATGSSVSAAQVAAIMATNNAQGLTVNGMPSFPAVGAWGNNWEIVARVATTNTTYDKGGLRVATCYYDKDKINLYYAGYLMPILGGATNYGQIIGMFGQNWDSMQKHGPVLSPTVGAWDSGNIGGARVYKFDSSPTNYMYYFASTNLKFEEGWQATGVATSTDGTNWTKYSGNPVLNVGPVSAFDGAGIQGAVAVIKYNDLYYMYYGGKGTNSDENIGLAVADNPLGPWTKYSGNPVVTNAADILAEPNIFPLENGSGWGMVLGQGSATSADLTNWTFHGAWTIANDYIGTTGIGLYLSPFLFSDNGMASLFDNTTEIFIARPKQAMATMTVKGVISGNLVGSTNLQPSNIATGLAGINISGTAQVAKYNQYAEGDALYGTNVVARAAFKTGNQILISGGAFAGTWTTNNAGRLTNATAATAVFIDNGDYGQLNSFVITNAAHNVAPDFAAVLLEDGIVYDSSFAEIGTWVFGPSYSPVTWYGNISSTNITGNGASLTNLQATNVVGVSNFTGIPIQTALVDASPTQWPGTLAWWDASDSTKFSPSGTAPTNWTDSASGFVIGVSNTTYVKYSTIWNKPGLAFVNNSASYAGLWLTNKINSNITVYVVATITNLNPYQVLLSYTPLGQSYSFANSNGFRAQFDGLYHYVQGYRSGVSTLRNVNSIGIEPFVFTLQFDGTNNLSRLNGLTNYSGLNAGGLATTGYFAVGGEAFYTDSNARFQGFIHEVVLRTNTDSQIVMNQTETALAKKWGVKFSPTDSTIWGFGDSITVGSPNITNWMSYLGLKTGSTIRNVGQYGNTASQAAGTYGTSVSNHIARGDVVISAYGINDIATSVTTGTILGSMTNIWKNMRLAGAKVLVAELMVNTNLSGGQETERLSYNATLPSLVTRGLIDGIVPYASDSRLGTYSGTYFADSVHPGEAAQPVMASIAFDAVSRVRTSANTFMSLPLFTHTQWPTNVFSANNGATNWQFVNYKSLVLIAATNTAAGGWMTQTNGVTGTFAP